MAKALKEKKQWDTPLCPIETNLGHINFKDRNQLCVPDPAQNFKKVIDHLLHSVNHRQCLLLATLTAR